MPTYVYQCPNGHTLETFEPMTAPVSRDCRECPKPAPRQSCKDYCSDCDDCCMNCEIDHYPVQMERVISGGAGVLWKGGPPTRKFGRAR